VLVISNCCRKIVGYIYSNVRCLKLVRRQLITSLLWKGTVILLQTRYHSIKDLGIMITSDLSWSTNCKMVVSRAYKQLGLIRRSFKTNCISVKKKSYNLFPWYYHEKREKKSLFEVRDLTAELMSEVCHNVSKDPSHQPLSGESLSLRTCIDS